MVCGHSPLNLLHMLFTRCWDLSAGDMKWIYQTPILAAIVVGWAEKVLGRGEKIAPKGHWEGEDTFPEASATTMPNCPHLLLAITRIL